MQISKLFVGVVLFSIFLSPFQMPVQSFQNDREFPSYLGRGWINDVLLSPQEDRLLVQTWLGLWLYDFPSMELRATAQTPPKPKGIAEQQYIQFSPTGDFIIIPVDEENINSYERLILLDGYSLEPKTSSELRNRPPVVSPDGWLAAYMDENSQIKLLDATTADEIASLDSRFRSVSFSPNSRWLATINGGVELWDLTTYSRVATMPGTNFAFSPDNQWFATAGEDDETSLWSLETYAEVATIPGNATQMAFSPDSTILTVLNADEVNEVTLWDITAREVIDTWPAALFDFSPQGQILITQSQDNTVILWDMATRQQIGMYMEAEAHRRVGPSEEFWFSPDGQTLAIDKSDGTISLWNMSTHSEMLIEAQHIFDFSPDGQILLTDNENDFNVQLWDVTSGQELGLLTGHQQHVSKVSFWPPYILTISSTGGTTILWEFDPATPRIMDKLRFQYTSVKDISPDGQLLRDSRGILNIDTGARVLTEERFDILPNWDKALIYFDTEDPSGIPQAGVRLWDIEANQELAVMEDHHSRAYGLVTRDEKFLITYSFERLRIWDLTTSEALKTYDEYATDVNAVVFSLDGDTVFTAEGDGTVNFWDMATGQLLRRLEGHAAPVLALALAPDGNTLASGDARGTIKLWNVTTGMERATLTDHWRAINDLEFSLDGQLLASAGDDTLFLWDVSSGISLNSLGGRTTEIAFAPDGQTFATVGADQNITLWDVETQEQQATLAGHTSMVTSVAFASNGEILASGDADGTVKLWDIAGQREILGTEGLDRPGEITRLIFSPNGGVLMILNTVPNGTNANRHAYSIWGVLENQQLQGLEFTALDMVFSSRDMLLAFGTPSGVVELDEVFAYDEHFQPAAEVTQNLLCRGYVDPRLTVGQLGQVLPGEDNLINSAPARASQSTVSQRVGAIPGGATFAVIDGPVCGDGGIVWWQVNYNGTVGWTGEGQNDSYWVQPYDPNVPTATANPVLEPTATLDFATPVVAQCPGTLPHRLIISGQGRVLPGDANLINSKPARLSEDSTNQRLGQIPGGGVFTVVAGPVCNGDIAWWQVEYEGVIGWTGEVQGNTYWVEPVQD